MSRHPRIFTAVGRTSVRAPSLVVVLAIFAGCGGPATPVEEPAFPLSSAPPVWATSTATDEPDPREASLRELLGEPPWTGRLVVVTHEYSNGCTDHRSARIMALEMKRATMPVIVGW